MTRRPRLLDLFCGAGGASAGYWAAGFDVVGVDIEPQPHYPFPFIHADALTVNLAGFDVVTASPPCQRYSRATPTGRRDDHADLIGPIRERLQAAAAQPDGPWAYVIENVPGAPLLDPVIICGDALRLGVRRHRLFESNLPLVGTRCWHDRTTPPVPVYGTYGQRPRRNPFDVEGGSSPPSTDAARAAMGITWMPWPNLTQAIPPAYTHWLGVQLLLHQSRDETAAVEPSPRDQTRRRIPSPRDASHPVDSITTSDETPAPGFRHCRCGTPLHRPATGRWPRHCSHACRQAAYRDRNGIR